MFYLKHFFLRIKNFPVTGILFCLMTIFIFTFSATFKVWSKKIENSKIINTDQVYFSAVLPESISESIIYKIKRLPGVQKVEVKSSEAIKKKVGEFIQNSNLQLPNMLSDYKNASLKVYLGSQVDQQGERLMREYILKLAGNERVKIGPVIRTSFEKNTALANFLKWFENLKYIIYLLFSLIWLGLFLSFIKSTYKIHYIIERFSPLHSVHFKVVSSGLLGIFVLSILPSIYLKNISMLIPVILLLFSLSVVFIHQKIAKWNN